MRKSFSYILIFLIPLLLITLFSPVFAQREKEDYLYNYEKYREVYTKFQSARDKFLKYRSLSAQKEAEQVTLEALIQRAETIRTYFIALKYTLRATSGVVAIKEKAELSSRLDTETIWLDSQKKDLEVVSNPTLDSLFEISDRLEKKDLELKILSYKTLAAILLGRERDLQGQSVSITNLLNDQIADVKAATEAAVLRQWLEEVKNKNYLSQKKIEASEAELLELDKIHHIPTLLKSFNTIQENLESSKYHLNQALSFEKEIFKKLTKLYD